MLSAFIKSKGMHKAAHAFCCYKIKTGFGVELLHLNTLLLLKNNEL